MLHRRRRGGKERVDPLHIERNQFTPMPHDDLQILMTVENARENQAHDMHADFVVPANAG
ncbi:hypothetical protein D3C81_2073740 [compost metagenome]